MQRGGFVYMMASARNGTLYLGVTSNLTRRVSQHREGVIEGFTKDYSVKMLVWFKHFAGMTGRKRVHLSAPCTEMLHHARNAPH